MKPIVRSPNRNKRIVSQPILLTATRTTKIVYKMQCRHCLKNNKDCLQDSANTLLEMNIEKHASTYYSN